MELKTTYEKFTECLAGLAGSSEPLDMLLLIESFLKAFDMHGKSESSSDKKISFAIADTHTSCSVEIDMGNDKRHIRLFQLEQK